MTIKLLSSERFSELDKHVLPRSEYEPDAIYVLDSTPPRCYRYCKNQQLSENEVLVQKDLEIEGVSESEIEIFVARMQSYHEVADVTELQTAYPMVSAKQMKDALCRAIKRMHLHDQKEHDILLGLAYGVTKQKLMGEFGFTLEQINSAVETLQNCIRCYCFSEYEKKYLQDRVDALNKGTEVFLYTNKTFSEQYGIPKILLSQIIENVVEKNKNLTEDEKIFIRRYACDKDLLCTSLEENERAHSIVKRVICDYDIAREMFSEKLVKDTAQKKINMIAPEMSSLPQEYVHQIKAECERMDIQWSLKYDGAKEVCDGTKIGEHFIADDNENTRLDIQTIEKVKEILPTCTPREARILRLSLGLDDGKMWSVDEIAEHLGVSRERVRQIESKALRKERPTKRSKRLADFLDD